MYERRWSGRHQHEFTPPGQEDLSRWTDMVTINTYPRARDLHQQRRQGADVERRLMALQAIPSPRQLEPGGP